LNAGTAEWDKKCNEQQRLVKKWYCVDLRALKHKNLQTLFAGHGTSLIGTWMQQLAMSWLVYRITGSAFLSWIGPLFSQIPFFSAHLLPA
jgi:hypothetical protein